MVAGHSMKKKTLCNGFSLSCLGMGTWGTGGRESRDASCDEASLVQVLRTGIETGYDRIDMAEYYAAGYSEELVGKAIVGMNRESVFLTSKVWKTNLRDGDVQRACERTLRRLGTDYLDLYLIHQVNEDVPLEETVGAMCDLVDSGKVRWIGVSNFSAARLRRAQASSRHPIVLNQVHYNVTVRECEASGLLSYCQEHDVMLEAWRPLRGLETGDALTVELCGKYGCTAHQLALAFLLCQRNVVTLTAMRSVGHMPENLRALEVSLSEEDIERIRREYPNQVMVSPTVPL